MTNCNRDADLVMHGNMNTGTLNLFDKESLGSLSTNYGITIRFGVTLARGQRKFYAGTYSRIGTGHSPLWRIRARLLSCRTEYSMYLVDT